MANQNLEDDSDEEVSTGSEDDTDVIANVYRLQEHVYIEVAPNVPYLIGQIVEFPKDSAGNLQVKVLYYYRRRDINERTFLLAGTKDPVFSDELPKRRSKQQLRHITRRQHQLKLCELYLTTPSAAEVYPLSAIRGHCTVVEFDDCTPASIIDTIDAFFYRFNYEPRFELLSIGERKSTRCGEMFQAEVARSIRYIVVNGPEGAAPRATPTSRETLRYNPYNGLTDEEIDAFITAVQAMGTFARGFEATDRPATTTSSRQSLTAATAVSRGQSDCSIQLAMDLLHQNGYDLLKAYQSLTPANQPILVKSTLEKFSLQELTLFEGGLKEFGKDFDSIRQEFLPWYSVYQLVELYYAWKSTDRYARWRATTIAKNRKKIKEVQVVFSEDQCPTLVASNDLQGRRLHCESCDMVIKVTKSTILTKWHQIVLDSQMKTLCPDCFSHWKKYGAFIMPHELADKKSFELAEPGPMKNGQSTSTANNTASKSNGRNSPPKRHTRSPFAIKTGAHFKQTCRELRNYLQIRRQARRPFSRIETEARNTVRDVMIEQGALHRDYAPFTCE